MHASPALRRAVLAFVAIALLPFCLHKVASGGNQSEFFALLKKSLSGNALSDWASKPESLFCNYTGIVCDGAGDAVEMNLSGWSLSGEFPDGICEYLPRLRVLRLGENQFRGGGKFLTSIVNCSHLEELSLYKLYLPGRVPDLSPMGSLRVMDLSYNLFTGAFPMSVFELTNLEELNFNENGGFDLWELPENVSRMNKLQYLILTTCMLQGQIPKSIGSLTSLVDLELSGNYLSGEIPGELGMLRNLKLLELYYNEFTGGIPESLGNLTELRDLDMSVNQLRGSIPESICKLPNLEALQLYNNSLSGEIPSTLGDLTTLSILSLYDNLLSGEIPRNLGKFSGMVLLDISENRFSGPLPAEVCRSGKLRYYLVLQNSFTGEIPSVYADCPTLLRFRVNNNNLTGEIPEGILGLPHTSIIDLSYNNLSGPIARSIGNAKNLSELFMQNNNILGSLPPEISSAVNLVKIDLSRNKLSGPIPSEIGNLRKLNLLLLQSNRFESSIPDSISSLKSLNVLDISDNHLMGKIPESLCALLPNSINFSSNLLAGPIPPCLVKGGLAESFLGNPHLCVSVYLNSSDKNFPICPQSYDRKRVNSVWVIGISSAVIIFGFLLFLKRRCSQVRPGKEEQEMLSPSFFFYDVKNFHRINFDHREILQAMVNKNIVGKGGSGTVYRIEMKGGEVLAVKKLWSRSTKDCGNRFSEDNLVLNRELKTEARGGKDSTTTVIAGTYGYLAPEYAYSSKANTKCDVYSFGVVLMELITGKKPVEQEFGENKNIIYWISTKVDTKEGTLQLLDKRISDSFGEDMIGVLRIAIRCTYSSPALRPTMNEVVQLLTEANPCKLNTCKSLEKAK
ncbi:hypothetical protein MLD38_002015 [Melastoma candidum]|uniref:Uncharacterized protein n=1 Tax=Melastoma candidum TaxID=119954 RepID=A0ACB9SF34_9MYRT|nr:hypothetical protein MLD38_002015 [Melastoma candidum]